MCRPCATEAATAFGEAATGAAPGRTAPALRTLPDRRAATVAQAARDWVERQLTIAGWRVDGSGRAGKSVDLVAWTETRTWYVQVRTHEGEDPVWPSGRELGWLKGAARRKDATAVVAFVRVVEPAWSVEFRSAQTRRDLSASP